MENRQNFQRDNNNRPPRRDDRGPRRDRRDRNEEPPEFEEKLVAVNRVTKTVKGGRNMRFSALIVIGDKKGRVGIGMGKAVEIPEAIRKASEAAKKNLVTISTKDTSIRTRPLAASAPPRSCCFRLPKVPALSPAARRVLSSSFAA